MTRCRERMYWCVLWVVAAGATQALWAQDRVADTVHNLSAGGPGRIRAVQEQQVCIFCHAPHHAGGARPLWNRELPTSNYRIYESSTLDAEPGQPVGSSKLCLSCHDGTIALGRVLNRADRIRMISDEFIPSGLANLGTDLSDDHPVSFFYTAGLAASDRQLANPRTLPHEIKLDASGQLQCTSCHDPHRNVYGKFLTMSDSFGALCTACHVMAGWSPSSHRSSAAVVAGSREGDWPYATVAENACRSCHRPHGAGGHERLLIFKDEEDNCLSCHDGRVARKNILAELDKRSAHDPRRYLATHDAAESSFVSKAHVECADCHNPHAVSPPAPDSRSIALGATMVQTPGVTSGGAPIEVARYEYEVCYRCHADTAVPVRRAIVRQSFSANVRLEFSSLNPSFHPVEISSSARDSVSLVPGLSRGAMIRCTDCHNNDSGPSAGGSGPDGPHGSIYGFLLERNYNVSDDTVESAFEYALCYKCHQRSSILADQSFSLHRLHIVDERTPCSACHDPHGISTTQAFGSDHTHLINFDMTIVRPDPVTRRLAFNDRGRLEGSCTLLCHGSEHRDRRYDVLGSMGAPAESPAERRRRPR